MTVPDIQEARAPERTPPAGRDALRNLSPLDGRYQQQVTALADELSEWGLMRQRLRVEVEWLILLGELPEIAEMRPLEPAEKELLRGLVDDFDDDDARAIKAWERQTNHDVKAVEYYLRDRLEDTSVAGLREFIHFACTSEDINNLSHGLMLKGGIAAAWEPAARALVAEVEQLARATRDVPLLSQTHGQPASPTTFGKEMAVFALRWRRQLERLEQIEYLGKFNGAVGTYGAHLVAYPEVDWQRVSRTHVEGLGLAWNPVTTQIEPHDWIAELFHVIARFNSILVDFNRDIWLYISRGCLRQRAVAGEVGSSTMPHKINPINFENSEANAGVSTALGTHMATTLETSRLQRDLSDSSLMRNAGAVLGHSLVALKAALRGLERVAVDEEACRDELSDRWEVLGEAVQTVLRKGGSADPYAELKAISRGRPLSREALLQFIESAQLTDADRKHLLELTPESYTGLASRLVDRLGDG
jgi:adenylosuccinate lyase